METTYAMGTASVAMCGSTVKVAADGSAIDPTPKCRVHGYGRDASIVAASRIEPPAAMIAMEPWPGANKDSA